MNKILFISIFFIGCGASVNRYDIGLIESLVGYNDSSQRIKINKTISSTKGFAEAVREFKKKKYDSAIVIFQSIIKNSNDLKIKLNSYMYLGFCYRLIDELKESTVCFMDAEKIWKKNYMKGSFVDNKQYSSGVLSRIYTELKVNFSKMGRPVIAAIYAWVALRKMETNDPFITVKKAKYNSAYLNDIDLDTFNLFYERLIPFKKSGESKFFRKAKETDKKFLAFRKRSGMKIHIFLKPVFSVEVYSPPSELGYRKDLFQVYYKKGKIIGYIFYAGQMGVQEKYSFIDGRLMSSLVELNTYNIKELRLRYDEKGVLKTFILITEMLHQPFYKFLPQFFVYKFN